MQTSSFAQRNFPSSQGHQVRCLERVIVAKVQALVVVLQELAPTLNTPSPRRLEARRRYFIIMTNDQPLRLEDFELIRWVQILWSFVPGQTSTGPLPGNHGAFNVWLQSYRFIYIIVSGFSFLVSLSFFFFFLFLLWCKSDSAPSCAINTKYGPGCVRRNPNIQRQSLSEPNNPVEGVSRVETRNHTVSHLPT
jgi:hypothetical protein